MSRAAPPPPDHAPAPRDAKAGTGLHEQTSHATTLVDAHAHLHPCFALPDALDHATRNFRAAARQAGLGEHSAGCLMLAETPRSARFASIRDGAADELGVWSVQPTGEACSLTLRHDDGTRLWLIAGRQIVTRERLEVLGLGTLLQPEEGAPIEATIERLLAADATVVLPWGVGKWAGTRGRVIERLLQRDWPGRLFVGDNGGRLQLSRTPRLFAVAHQHDIPILPGSDPLPMPRQVRKLGGYGFVLDHALDADHPAASLHAALNERTTSPPAFGRRETLPGFIVAQTTMQLRKRLLGART